MDKRVYLKVKIKSLAEEARIIRKEESRARTPELKQSLKHHRKWDVRNEARATLVAYGYLRGKKLCEIEPKMKNSRFFTLYVEPRVKAMVDKYGTPEQRTAYSEWKKANLPS